MFCRSIFDAFKRRRMALCLVLGSTIGLTAGMCLTAPGIGPFSSTTEGIIISTILGSCFGVVSNYVAHILEDNNVKNIEEAHNKQKKSQIEYIINPINRLECTLDKIEDKMEELKISLSLQQKINFESLKADIIKLYTLFIVNQHDFEYLESVLPSRTINVENKVKKFITDINLSILEVRPLKPSASIAITNLPQKTETKILINQETRISVNQEAKPKIELSSAVMSI